MGKYIFYVVGFFLLGFPLWANATPIVVDAEKIERMEKYIEIRDPAQLETQLEKDRLDREHSSLLLFSMLGRQPTPLLMKVVIEKGADATAQFILPKRGGVNLLFIALQQYAKPNIIQFLITQGVDVNARITGETLPHLTVLMVAAASTPYPEIIDMLLSAGADPNVVVNGRTAANYIDINPYLQNTQMLIRLKQMTQKNESSQ